jgi:serine/threonine-protein kinase
VSVTSDPLDGAVLERRYRVDTKIADGGMSTVYRGVDLRLDRPVAIKVMDSRYAHDSQFLHRFQLEARAVAKLKDPGLVPVYDQGFDLGRPFLVMELVEGGTLRELLHERGPMPPYAVAAVLKPVLSGLSCAHRAGLVHRDVKPENVLISDDGDIRLVDFGLVRAFAEASITSTSVILGTAAYLAPEQVTSGAATPQSDIYAVGILAYELLTGRTPFNGDTQLAVAYQRVECDVPQPSLSIGGVPPEFDSLIERAAARLPEDRYADAGEMNAELTEICETLALPDFRVPAPRNSAQHAAATFCYQRMNENQTAEKHLDAHQQHAPHHPTRQLLLEPAEPESPLPTSVSLDHAGLSSTAIQFAGIDLYEFILARQRSRRVLVAWVLAILVVTGLVAAGAWTLGTHLVDLTG